MPRWVARPTTDGISLRVENGAVAAGGRASPVGRAFDPIDRVVKAWRLADGTHVRDFGQGGKGLTESIHSPSISSDGKLLAAADGSGQAAICSLLE